MDIFDVLPGELEGEPSAARALKVLAKAKELGWTENPACSLVLRLTREDALPFYARWDLAFDPESGKKSWRFQGARAVNGQPLNYNDISTYLENPDVIYPEPPSIPEDDTDESVRTALGALKILTEPDPAYINGPPGGHPIPLAPPSIPQADWGALLA
jgi:hypothetical protein